MSPEEHHNAESGQTTQPFQEVSITSPTDFVSDNNSNIIPF